MNGLKSVAEGSRICWVASAAEGGSSAARLLMTELHVYWQVTGNGFNQTYSTPITGGTYRQVISAPGAPGSYSVVSRLVPAFSSHLIYHCNS